SLSYFLLGISDPSHGVPEFISVGYVDSYPIITYDSVTGQKEPRAPRMVENLASDHCERYTQFFLCWDPFPTKFHVRGKRLRGYLVKKMNWEIQLPNLNARCLGTQDSCTYIIFFFLEPPLVRLNHKETFPRIAALFCRAPVFYPPQISIMWMKNGEEVEYGDILPSGVGTYQTRAGPSGQQPLLLSHGAL
ncbi:LOW QUALITY PROTEIN: major histocompatibility complex class I-related gene protein, partial [Dipodomys spectabilis]|uniref:LOW QUALITY PROTEIN: major histocompatibility complex class I-related gene protein n=1 Tax=Dipodomys spectabilis TaxID=105255 RepID=UPI001C543BD6